MSPTDDKKQERAQIKRKLREEVGKEMKPLLLGSMALLASSLSNQAFPRLMGRLIDQKQRDDQRQLAPQLCLVVLGGGLASFLRTSMLAQAQHAIACRLRKQAFRTIIQEKDVEWFQSETLDEATTAKEQRTGVSPGAIGSVMSQDVDTIANVLTTSFSNLLRSTSSVVFSTYHMLSLNPTLFGASVTVIPVVGAAAMLLRKSIQRLTTRQRECASEAASFVEERVLHIGMVKLSNQETNEVQKYCEMQDEHLELDRTLAMRQGLFMGFLFIASSGALLLVVNLGGKSVVAGKISSGELTSFATYSFLLGVGTSGIVKALGEIAQGMVSAERYYRLIDPSSSTISTETEDTNKNVETESEVDTAAVDSIEFKDVCFGYKSSDKTVLKDVSFKLQRGKVTALVGKNGSGKTTTTSVLAGLHKPSAGYILLPDGRDFSRLDKTIQGKLVQVVPQSAALFNMTILENVRYSNPNATEEDVRRVLKQVNCEKFASKLDFVVGLNGSKLSGGERQKIGLARALLSDPCVLVLDEPASALDAEGESAVSEAIIACKSEHKRALLLITHHAKSLALADEVLVLKDGQIVERGRYEELKSKKACYLRELMPDLD